jgi:hypothetical protein
VKTKEGARQKLKRLMEEQDRRRAAGLWSVCAPLRARLRFNGREANSVGKSPAPPQLDQRHLASADLSWRHLMGGMVEQLRIRTRAFRFGFAYPVRRTPASVGVTVA